MKRILLTLVCLLLIMVTFAQKGEVFVVKDPLIDSIIAKRNALSRISLSPTAPKLVVVNQFGYRVQVFYGDDRREVFNQQARFKSLYPKYNAYITFKSPNYYLRVGDFRTRMEAQSFLNTLRPAFPTLFIFREKINAPDLDK